MINTLSHRLFSALSRVNNGLSLRRALLMFALLLNSGLIMMPASAIPSARPDNVPVTLDPQVAPAPASPFIYPTINNANGTTDNGATNNGLTNNGLTNNGLTNNNTVNAPTGNQGLETGSQPPALEPLPNPLNNPATLASQMQPTDNTLSQANQELLSRNAKLQRDVNELQTQVNVLVEERSGQLFMYGAFTVAVSLVLGFLFGWLFFGRRDRW